MDEWLDRFADALGEDRLERDEVGSILRLAREVAHGVERKLAPLSTFVAGRYVARAIAEGTSAADALDRVSQVAQRLIAEDPAQRADS